MERWHLSWRVIEHEWTFAQLQWALRGIRLNERAKKEAMERAREQAEGGYDAAAPVRQVSLADYK